MPKVQTENLENKYNSLNPDPTSWEKAKFVRNNRVQLLSHQPTASVWSTRTNATLAAACYWLVSNIPCKVSLWCHMQETKTALQNPTVFLKYISSDILAPNFYNTKYSHSCDQMQARIYL
jgi:hypothetical protein